MSDLIFKTPFGWKDVIVNDDYEYVLDRQFKYWMAEHLKRQLPEYFENTVSSAETYVGAGGKIFVSVMDDNHQHVFAIPVEIEKAIIDWYSDLDDVQFVEQLPAYFAHLTQVAIRERDKWQAENQLPSRSEK